MRHSRDICYPASIWIPYHELHDTSPDTKLLIMGWTKEMVDDAREIIYAFIKTEIGEQVTSLQPVIHQQDVWETRKQDSQHDRYQNEDQGQHEGAQWDQLDSTYDDLPGYGNNVEVTAPGMLSDKDDIAANLDIPPVEVHTELKKGTDMMVVMYDKEEIMHNECEDETEELGRSTKADNNEVDVNQDDIVAWTQDDVQAGRHAEQDQERQFEAANDVEEVNDKTKKSAQAKFEIQP